MASALPVGSSADIDFTAGEMTLLRALIAGPPTLNRHPLASERRNREAAGPVR